MSRISVKDAVKRYGNNTVIPDLNLEIGDGELFTLLGQIPQRLIFICHVGSHLSHFLCAAPHICWAVRLCIF